MFGEGYDGDEGEGKRDREGGCSVEPQNFFGFVVGCDGRADTRDGGVGHGDSGETPDFGPVSELHLFVIELSSYGWVVFADE